MIGAILGDIVGSPYEFDCGSKSKSRNSFEDVIRTAASLGGACDTLTAISGSIAEGFYGVPAELKKECYKRLPDPLLKVLKMFEEKK